LYRGLILAAWFTTAQTPTYSGEQLQGLQQFKNQLAMKRFPDNLWPVRVERKTV